MEKRIYTITENGFSMTDNTVQVPHCKIAAESYIEAADILSEFLRTKQKPDCMELITPMEKIAFD